MVVIDDLEKCIEYVEAGDDINQLFPSDLSVPFKDPEYVWMVVSVTYIHLIERWDPSLGSL